eukprot:351369-Chlamydomonas_euryale.AAC.9
MDNCRGPSRTRQHHHVRSKGSPSHSSPSTPFFHCQVLLLKCNRTLAPASLFAAYFKTAYFKAAHFKTWHLHSQPVLSDKSHWFPALSTQTAYSLPFLMVICTGCWLQSHGQIMVWSIMLLADLASARILTSVPRARLRTSTTHTSHPLKPTHMQAAIEADAEYVPLLVQLLDSFSSDRPILVRVAFVLGNLTAASEPFRTKVRRPAARLLPSSGLQDDTKQRCGTIQSSALGPYKAAALQAHTKQRVRTVQSSCPSGPYKAAALQGHTKQLPFRTMQSSCASGPYKAAALQGHTKQLLFRAIQSSCPSGPCKAAVL